ncbi:hypothetical protein [Novipirellula rosea]|uniref:Uncharacterized protein n=1 Tax=Novipirellula rosea TaxID=1031540 RepID=A0ABP8M6G2_9BACT
MAGTTDATESIRKQLVAELNSADNTKAELEAKHGKVWTTSEMQEEFEALGFMAPFIIVSKRDTGERGSLMFTHSPRFYFSFKPE